MTKQQHPHPDTFHFFAASVAQWATTKPDRDLRQLLKLMDRDGYPYNLFLVPAPYDANYDIEWFQPKVEGAQWLGHFVPKKGMK